MAKDGQAKVLTEQEFTTLLETIEENRHPEKNSLIMQISFKLGLRAQEISLLRIREVADIGPQFSRGYKIKSILVLPKSFTKGARAKKRATSEPKRTSVRFTLKEFETVVRQIEAQAKSGICLATRFIPYDDKQNSRFSRHVPLCFI